MPRPDVGLPELNAVAAVAAHKSFRAAAAELGISPSALSHAIAALEQRLGVRLFHRTTRSVSIAEAGDKLLARVRPALREISEAMAELGEDREAPAGTLRINASHDAVRLQLMPVVLAFLERYPAMRVEVVTDDALVDIVAGGFDAGVRGVADVAKDMVAVPFGPAIEYAIVGAPRYFKRHPPPRAPADLLQHNCIRRRWPSGAVYRWELENRRKQLVLDVPGSLTVDRDELMVTAALRGIGLAYTVIWAVQAEFDAGRLVRVLSDWTPPSPGLCLYYPSRRHVRRGLRAFVELLRAQLPPAHVR